MTDNWLSEWSNSKIELALKLNTGECGGSYAESAIILCSVLSAISADIWPGRHIDKKRFVELLVKYSTDTLQVKRISTPLLVNALETKNMINESNILVSTIMPKSEHLVVNGEDVDKYENEILEICPEIDRTIIKQNSYANILYEEIRSGYAHEYMPGTRSDSWAMGSKRNNSLISYVNRADMPHRLIHFNINWLCNLVKSIVDNIENENEKPIYPTYSQWWLTDT